MSEHFGGELPQSPELVKPPEWYEDGIRRTVVTYPAQDFAPQGSENVFYNQPGDTINLFREEPRVNPSASPGHTTAVYGLSCEVTDETTHDTFTKRFYISHDQEVILVDQGDGSAPHPVRLHRMLKQVTIDGPFPAAELSNTPANPHRQAIVKSVLLFADDWRRGEGGRPEVRASPFISDTLPETAIPRDRRTEPNPLVTILPEFQKADEYLTAQGM